MSLSAFAVGSMLPQAAQAVGTLAESAARVGQGFLVAMRQHSAISDPSTDSVQDSTAPDAIADSDNAGSNNESDSRLCAWCRKLAGWLRSKGVEGNVTVRAQLDELDQPQFTSDNPTAAAALTQLSESPELAAEFRELVLDRAEARRPAWVGLDHSRIENTESLASLTVQLDSDNPSAKWHD